jgi:hypothetical protein
VFKFDFLKIEPNIANRFLSCLYRLELKSLFIKKQKEAEREREKERIRLVFQKSIWFIIS